MQLTTDQMSAGQRQIEQGFVMRLSSELAARYHMAMDETLIRFVDQRRAEALRHGFETDAQVADFTEACLLTQDAMLRAPEFEALMRRPLMRPEAKAERILRRWVWPHPSYRPAPLPQAEEG